MIIKESLLYNFNITVMQICVTLFYYWLNESDVNDLFRAFIIFL